MRDRNHEFANERGNLPLGGELKVTQAQVFERDSMEVEISRRRSEILLRATLDSIDDGVLVVSKSGHVSHYNAKFIKLWSIPAGLLDQRENQTLLECAATQLVDPAAFLGSFEEIDASQGSTHDLLHFKDGRIIERSFAPLDLVDDEPARMWLFRDVTASINAVDALRTSQELLSESQRAAQIGSWDLDLATGILVWSEECYRHFGYCPGEIQPSHALLLDRLVVAEDRALLEQHHAATLAAGALAQPLEFRIRRTDGSLRWLRVTGGVKCDAFGMPLRFLGTQQDITERKKNEEERLELERRLLHAQKLESLGLLAGGIAHDFNNLLSVILGNLDLARLEYGPDAQVHPYLSQAILAAQKATVLTHQMLAYSGRAHANRSTINLNAIVQDNALLLQTSASKLVSIDLALDQYLPPMVGNPAQIQQLIMNLMINAAEAIGDRSGTITLKSSRMDYDRQQLQSGRIEEPPAPGTFTCLDITDTGCGMDPTTVQRLFEPFFTTKARGRGLGMSAILGIVRSHRGTIFVDSTVGTGTTIRVLFPFAGEPPSVNSMPQWSGARGAESHAELPATRGFILVVDDEDAVRDVCARMLRKMSWRVLTAADGHQAIETFRTHAANITCVIVDLSMPDMNGVAACREIRKIKDDALVILSSGYTSEQPSVHHTIAEGFSGFIQKPYDVQALENEIHRVLSGAGISARTGAHSNTTR